MKECAGVVSGVKRLSPEKKPIEFVEEIPRGAVNVTHGQRIADDRSNAGAPGILSDEKLKEVLGTALAHILVRLALSR